MPSGGTATTSRAPAIPGRSAGCAPARSRRRPRTGRVGTERHKPEFGRNLRVQFGRPYVGPSRGGGPPPQGTALHVTAGPARCLPGLIAWRSASASPQRSVPCGGVHHAVSLMSAHTDNRSSQWHFCYCKNRLGWLSMKAKRLQQSVAAASPHTVPCTAVGAPKGERGNPTAVLTPFVLPHLTYR